MCFLKRKLQVIYLIKFRYLMKDAFEERIREDFNLFSKQILHILQVSKWELPILVGIGIKI